MLKIRQYGDCVMPSTGIVCIKELAADHRSLPCTPLAAAIHAQSPASLDRAESRTGCWYWNICYNGGIQLSMLHIWWYINSYSWWKQWKFIHIHLPWLWWNIYTEYTVHLLVKWCHAATKPTEILGPHLHLRSLLRTLLAVSRNAHRSSSIRLILLPGLDPRGKSVVSHRVGLIV